MSLDAALAPGQMLLHYRLVEPIGEGGMGVVWKAFDTTLERPVALKVLPRELTENPDLLRRFGQEARLLAALNHPNVAVIYGLHQVDAVHFFTMELVEGEDLSTRVNGAPLPLATALTLGGQMAAALEATHARGITHRDLKPANVRVTPSGVVKVLDFGIAKALEPSAGVNTGIAKDYATSTRVGTAVGTPRYMSPEQARGDMVDSRCDIWAFGCVLFETLAGASAFGGTTVSDVLASVLRDEPDWSVLPASVPAPVLDLLRRCLTKSGEHRLADISVARSVLADALARLSGGVAARGQHAQASVAVLPFANMSADAENQYFSDGLAEDLINALTRLPGLHVASRTSAFRFRGTDLDIRKIGEELHVGAIVEGSVRRAGNRLRVTAQLINVSNGYHLWSDRYDREFANVFDIQDDIVSSIVTALAPALIGEAKDIVHRPTDNPEAYELYLKGRHYWHQRTPSTLRLAMQLFEQVISVDPTYALAYTGLADCYGILRAYGWMSAADSRPRALEAVTRAMQLDPTLAEAHFSQGMFTYYFEPAWHQAEAHFKKAIAINPRWAMAHAYYGFHLASDYRFDEAVGHANVAREIDPLSPLVHVLAAGVLTLSRRFDAAEQAARRAHDLQPDHLIGFWIMGMALYGLGRIDKGISATERAVALSRAPLFVGMLGLGYGRAGRVDEAAQLVRELDDRRSRGEYVAPFAPLAIHVGLRDVGAVRSALEACLAEGTPVLSVELTCGIFLEEFRDDPAIDALLDRLHDGARPRAT